MSKQRTLRQRALRADRENTRTSQTPLAGAGAYLLNIDETINKFSERIYWYTEVIAILKQIRHEDMLKNPSKAKVISWED